MRRSLESTKACHLTSFGGLQMILPVFVVAKNTYIEMIRDRVLYFVVIFTVLFMFLCFALGQLSYKEIFRLSVSLGLGGIHLCFVGLTIFLGCNIFYREIERKTIYTLLAKPVSRTQYLLGKYFGLIALLLTMLMGFMLCFTLIEYFLDMPLLITSYYGFPGFFFEACVLLAVTFFFSCFTNPFLSATGALSFFLVGHWVYNLEKLSQETESKSFKMFANFIHRTFPDLERLNWKDYAILKSHVPYNDLIIPIVASLVWSCLFFLLALIIFREKDFE